MTPMTMPCHGATYPEAGVMVPRPATAPEIIPSTDGLRRGDHSIAPPVSAPAHAARGAGGVAVGGLPTPARDPAVNPEPPLKPNQPTHNIPVPITACDKSNGDRFS